MRKRRLPRDPTALTDGEMGRIRGNLDKLEERYISFMCPVTFKFNDVINWLFSEANQKIMRDAFRLGESVSTYGAIKALKFMPDAVTQPPGMEMIPGPVVPFPRRVTFHVKLKNMLFPKSEFVQDIIATPLAMWCKDANAAAMNFAQVRAVLEWFNKNGTPGAIRNYWPCILPLLPDDSPVKHTEGFRCKEPIGMGERLAVIRESTEFLTSAHLLPHDVTLNKAEAVKAMFVDAPYHLSGSNYFSVC